MARKIKLFLDANTIISALVFDGIYRKALRCAIKKDFILITSEYVLDEIYEVLMEKFPTRVDEIIKLLSLIDIKIVPAPSIQACNRYKNILRDDKDVPVLVSAIKAGADILLTGDNDFLNPRVTERIQVNNAVEFVKRFNNT